MGNGKQGWAKMRAGLVLGIFALLRKGHQLLIETALIENAPSENDPVSVMIREAPQVTIVMIFSFSSPPIARMMIPGLSRRA